MDNDDALTLRQSLSREPGRMPFEICGPFRKQGAAFQQGIPLGRVLIEVRLVRRKKQVRQFLSEFRRWAVSRPDILTVALVGSYARNDATGTSDVDLAIVAEQPLIYLQDTR